MLWQKNLLKRACNYFSAEDPDEIVETPSTTEEAEDEDDLEEDGEDSGGQDDPDSEQNMEVDPPNVTANPDKFQKLISFGQKVIDYYSISVICVKRCFVTKIVLTYCEKKLF